MKRTPEITGTAETLDLHRRSDGSLILGTVITDGPRSWRVDITVPAKWAREVVDRFIYDAAMQAA